MTKRSMRILMVPALVLALGACGDDEGGALFDEVPAATSGPASMIVVESAGESWELPAAVCLQDEADADVLLAVAQQQAANVRSLVGSLISGWPTTTYALSFDHQAYERDLQVAGVTALTLAGLAGEQAALEQAWDDWEQSFADPDQGWGPPYEISGRISGWKAEARALTEAIAAHCAGQ
jgi:hypothetical protein